MSGSANPPVIPSSFFCLLSKCDLQSQVGPNPAFIAWVAIWLRGKRSRGKDGVPGGWFAHSNNSKRGCITHPKMGLVIWTCNVTSNVFASVTVFILSHLSTHARIDPWNRSALCAIRGRDALVTSTGVILDLNHICEHKAGSCSLRS